MAADYPPPSSRAALSKASPSPPPPPQAPPLFSSQLQYTNTSRALQGLGSCKGITNWRDLARESEGRETEERERDRQTDRQKDRKRIGVFGGGDLGKECGLWVERNWDGHEMMR